ncbi:hypothetical protein GQ600_2182 [Phytophthora cactorum]|nr:hypothetical protein GQ600_2182 [Phytophthora cactorum]
MMDWCVAIRRIAACSTAIQCADDAFDAELKTLLGFLGHEDGLVVYAAKEELRRSLLAVELRLSRTLLSEFGIPEISSTATKCLEGEASGFQLQLLRQLVKMKNPGGSEDHGRKDGSSDDEGVNQWGIHWDSGTQRLHTCRVHDYDCTSLGSVRDFVFMSDFVKRLHSLEMAECSQVELSEQMMAVVKDVFVTMNYGSQPTFVSCAVLGLLGDFQELVKSWMDQTQVDEEHI